MADKFEFVDWRTKVMGAVELRNKLVLERHHSQPYNPNIANGFFRAGYVETWGRGIEKICEACKKHDVPLPEYKLHLEDIMVKFTPLMSTKVPKQQSGTLNGTLSGTLEEKYY